MEKGRTIYWKILAKSWQLWLCLFSIVTSKGQSNISLPPSNPKGLVKYSLTCCIKDALLEVDFFIHPEKLISESLKIDNCSLQIVNGDILFQNMDLPDSTITQWMEQANADSIHIYSLRNHGSSICILSSQVNQATGLSNNMIMWLIIDIENGFIYSINSLVNDINLFYFKDQNLRMIAFDYSDNFLENKDYSDIDFEVTYFSFLEGQAVVSFETTTKCPCN